MELLNKEIYPNYEVYCTIFNDLREHPDFMSEDEYNQFSDIALHIHNGLDFVPLRPGNLLPPTKVANNVNRLRDIILNNGLNFNNLNPDQLLQNVGTAAFSILAKQGLETLSKMTSGDIKVNPFSMTGAQEPKGPSGAGGGGTLMNPFDAKRINYASKPVELTWSTPIVPNTYGPYFLETTYTEAPLHITCCNFWIQTGDKEINRFIDQFITLAYQNAVQASVSFSINLLVLTPEKIIQSINAVAQALQVYYSYMSIISYVDNPNNRNEGLLRLRQLLSANDLSDLYIMQRILLQTPIPPKLMELMFYISQNFQSSSLPGSAIIRISPVPFVANSEDIDNIDTTFLPRDGMVNEAIEALTSNNVRDVLNILSRACPSWINEKLFTCPDVAIHDSQFSTLFANLPFVYRGHANDKNTTYFGQPGPVPQNYLDVDLVGTYKYNSYVDILDGGIFGLFTGYSMSENEWLPGLIQPAYMNDNKLINHRNRFSYTTETFGALISRAFRNQCDKIFNAGSSRGETYIISEGHNVAAPYQRFGTETCLNVRPETVRQASFALLEWLLCIDDIGRGTSQKAQYKAARSTKLQIIKPSIKRKRG